MQQNVRLQMRIPSEYNEEAEFGRYLVELGTFGYLVIWTVKVGLVVALVRAYRLLKRTKRRGAAAASLSYALLTLTGSLTYDHIWQALYFIGCGFILAEIISVVKARPAAAAAPQPVAVVAMAAP